MGRTSPDLLSFKVSPLPKPFVGHTPYTEQAAQSLGLTGVPTSQVGVLPPFAVAVSLISQASHRIDLSHAQRVDVVAEARKKLAILQVAAASLELILEEAEEALTAPELDEALTA